MLPAAGMPRIPVFENNEGAVQLAQNPITNSNSKHIDVRHHFLKELVEEERCSDHPRAVPVSACRFSDRSKSPGLFEFHRNLAMTLWEDGLLLVAFGNFCIEIWDFLFLS